LFTSHLSRYRFSHDKSLPEILEYGAPFPHLNKATDPSVYEDGYIVIDGGKRTINKGEILRIANLLANPAALLSIDCQFANKGTSVCENVGARTEKKFTKRRLMG
jgi:hypothetical protein